MDTEMMDIALYAIGFVFILVGLGLFFSDDKNVTYARYVFRHKYFVLREGLKLKVPLWRLLAHDWTKFLPVEWSAYATFFYGGWRTSNYKGESSAPAPLQNAYDLAWNHHMKANDHHWQWWVMFFDDGNSKVLEMSDVARREMLADWRGAGLATGHPDTVAWYATNQFNMTLHPTTRAWIEAELRFR